MVMQALPAAGAFAGCAGVTALSGLVTGLLPSGACGSLTEPGRLNSGTLGILTLPKARGIRNVRIVENFCIYTLRPKRAERQEILLPDFPACRQKSTQAFSSTAKLWNTVSDSVGCGIDWIKIQVECLKLNAGQTIDPLRKRRSKVFA